MNIKKSISFVLALLMIVSLLGACGTKGTAGDSSSATTSKAAATSDVVTEIKMPITTTPITLKYWMPLDATIAPLVKTMADTDGYKELEKISGVKFEFIHPALKTEAESFNLMMATDDLPDVIDFSWTVDASVKGGAAKYLASGHIVKINDIIEKYSPNLKAILEKDKDLKKQVSTESGMLYMYPNINSDPFISSSSGFQIRKDWLDKLKLEVPKTIDDWYKVLTAFYQNDPNGNGTQDEIPYTGQPSAAGRGFTAIEFFMPAFGITNGGYQDPDGKQQYGPIQPAFKEFLTTMKKWYDEKLIDPDLGLNDKKAMDSKVTTNKSGAYYGKSGGNLNTYLTAKETEDPSFKLVGVPYPIGPAGKPYTNWDLRTKVNVAGGAVITKANKYVRETAMLLDYAYTKEGIAFGNYGIKDKTYTLENGEPKFNDFGIQVYNDGKTDVLSRYKSPLPKYLVDVTSDPRVTKFQAVLDARRLWSQADTGLILPKVTLSDEDSQKISQIMTPITTYKDEMMTKFILGKEPIENFDKYINTIKDMNIDEALKIQNAAIEKYNAR